MSKQGSGWYLRASRCSPPRVRVGMGATGLLERWHAAAALDGELRQSTPIRTTINDRFRATENMRSRLVQPPDSK